jgi:hypothetical protein
MTLIGAEIGNGMARSNDGGSERCWISTSGMVRREEMGVDPSQTVSGMSQYSSVRRQKGLALTWIS